jgi:hypothetical protein
MNNIPPVPVVVAVAVEVEEEAEELHIHNLSNRILPLYMNHQFHQHA